jgi:GrpB-like predicted nucleotidyltransferase (UPF0157 family)
LGFQKSPYVQFVPVFTGAITYLDREYTVNAYVLSPTSASYQKWIAFRDYLLNHPEEAKAYDELKRHTVTGKKTGYREYQQVKMPFIKSIMAKIHTLKDDK